MYTLNKLDLQWLSGWLEGEGSFYSKIQSTNKNKYRRLLLMVSASSVDYDTLLKAQEIVGGKIYGPYAYKGREQHQDIYQWQIHRLNEAERLMRILRPYMSTRRQEQIDKCFNTLRNYRQLKA